MIKTEDDYFIFDKPRNENIIYFVKYVILGYSVFIIVL